MRSAPVIVNRREKRIEGRDEPDCRHGAGSSTHPELEKKTFLTAGTASRRGTRLSSSITIASAWLCGVHRIRQLLKAVVDLQVVDPDSAE